MRVAWQIAALAFVLTGCGFEVVPCNSDNECPPGTKCLRPTSTRAAQCLVVEADAGTSTEPDTGEQPDPAQDMGSGGGAEDTGRTVEPGMPLASCVPEGCGSEPNNTPDEAVRLTTGRIGCGSAGGWRVEREDLLCEGDVDHYAIAYQNCVGDDFDITVELYPRDPECSANVTFRPALGCGNRSITCRAIEGGSAITFRVRSSLQEVSDDFLFNIIGAGAGYNFVAYAH